MKCASLIVFIGGIFAASMWSGTSEARCLVQVDGRCLKEVASCRTVSGPVAKERRSPGAFRAIHVKGGIDVDVAQGSGHAVTVEAPAAAVPLIETRVSGDTLIIQTTDCINVRGILKVSLTTERLDSVDIKGSGDVRGQTPIRSQTFRINIAGSGDVDLDLAADELKLRIAGSGDVRLRGTARKQSVAVQGSGDVRATRLRSAHAQVAVQGSGDARVFVTESIDATVHGSGDIVYMGKPKNVSKSVHGSGDIRAGD